MVPDQPRRKASRAWLNMTTAAPSLCRCYLACSYPLISVARNTLVGSWISRSSLCTERHNTGMLIVMRIDIQNPWQRKHMISFIRGKHEEDQLACDLEDQAHGGVLLLVNQNALTQTGIECITCARPIIVHYMETVNMGCCGTRFCTPHEQLLGSCSPWRPTWVLSLASQLVTCNLP